MKTHAQVALDARSATQAEGRIMKSVAVLWMGVFFLVLLAFGAAAPPVAHAGLNDAQEPGSVLVFPYFRQGTVATVESNDHPKTEIEISVTCPRGTQCADGEAVKLKALWVCPGDAVTNTCGKVAFDLETTVNGTLVFHPGASAPPTLAGETVVPGAPCNRGFLLVWVVDHLGPTGRPIKYDGLIGNAVIRETTRPVAAYNAIGIQAGLLLPVRAPTDRNHNGKLDFNGIEYMPVTGKIFGTVRYPQLSGATGFPIDDTWLILLTLDVVAGGPNPPTSVDFDFFKADETLVHADVSFVCWTRVLLAGVVGAIDPGLTAAVMGRKGLVESTSAVQASRAVTLLGLVETVEYAAPPDIQRAWIYSLNTGGRPVPTTFAP
jgi:hypothetical protein